MKRSWDKRNAPIESRVVQYEIKEATSMRAIALMLILAVFTSLFAPAWAGDREKRIVGGILALIAASKLARSSVQPCPASQFEAPIYLQTASRPLGNLLIREVSGSSNVRWIAGQVLGDSGWAVIYDEDRRTAQEEQRRYGNGGQVPVASYFATIRAEFRQGREYDRSEYSRPHSSGNGGRERICTVYLRIAGGGNTYLATGVGSSWSRYDRFDWRTCGYSSSRRDYTPTNDDRALLAAMVDASNQITQQASQSLRLPAEAVSTGVHCRECGAEVKIVGAKFSPCCGKPLQ